MCIPKSSFTFLFLEDKNHILVRLHVDVSDNVLHFASVGDKVHKQVVSYLKMVSCHDYFVLDKMLVLLLSSIIGFF